LDEIVVDDDGVVKISMASEKECGNAIKKAIEVVGASYRRT
jgi:ribosomal protein S5